MSANATGPVVVLAGGVGAARYLRGVIRAVPHEDLTIIVNTGDDREFYGVHVSPDIDIVSYTLADRIDSARGFGLAGTPIISSTALRNSDTRSGFASVIPTTRIAFTARFD